MFRFNRTLLLGLTLGLFVVFWHPDVLQMVFARTDYKTNTPLTTTPLDATYQRSEVMVKIPDLVLTNQHAGEGSLRKLVDTSDLVAVNFIFTSCPTVCPVFSATFAELQRSLDLERIGLRLVSVSIDPAQDTPERLKSYAEKFQAGLEWQFLTGRVKDIDAVLRAFDAYRGEKMNHPQVVFLHRRDSGTWIRLDGLASPEAITAELTQLSKSVEDFPQ